MNPPASPPAAAPGESLPGVTYGNLSASGVADTYGNVSVSGVVDGFCLLTLRAPAELVCEARAGVERMHEELRWLIDKLDAATPGTLAAEAIAEELRAALLRSGPVIAEVCLPPLLEALEHSIELALAPYFATLAEAAAACRESQAWEALHLAFSVHPADQRELASQAQWQLDALAAILGGRVEWFYQGAEVPPGAQVSAPAERQGDTVSHRAEPLHETFRQVPATAPAAS